MATQIIYDMSIAVGSIEMAGYGTDFDATTEVEVKDTTTLSSTGWRTVDAGLKGGSFNLSFFQDYDNASVDETLFGYLAARHVPKSFCFGSADGSPAYLMEGISLEYVPVRGAVGDMAGGVISGRTSRGPVVRGKMLHPGSASRTASAAGTGRQLGAVASGKKLYAALHVLTVSGTSPTLDVKIQSDDNSGFTSATDRISFTQATARTYEFSSVAGAITDDYWRVSYTIGGSDTPTFAFLVTAGIL